MNDAQDRNRGPLRIKALLLAALLAIACGPVTTAGADTQRVDLLWQENVQEFEVSAFCVDGQLFYTFAGGGSGGVGAVQVTEAGNGTIEMRDEC